MAALKLFAFMGVMCMMANGQQEGTVALFQDGQVTNQWSGIVQVYTNGLFTGVCNTNFGTSEADVVCRQLGYTGAQNYSTVGQQQFGSIDNATLSADCSSFFDYQVLFQCSINDDAECDLDNAVTVTCVNTRIWNDPYSGQIRLQGGDFTSEGVLEIYCNDNWGTVCANGFGSSEINVACEQLGYSDGTLANQNAANNSQIWLNNVDCSSSDNCIGSCQSCPSSDTTISCTDDYVVYLQCSADSSTTNSNTLSSCDFDAIARAIATLIGIIVGVVVGIFVIACLVIFVPICICCCCGVGIAASKS